MQPDPEKSQRQESAQPERPDIAQSALLIAAVHSLIEARLVPHTMKKFRLALFVLLESATTHRLSA
jgi:hypothetical protein